MAATLWGRVYYENLFAGVLRQEPSGRCIFTYDPSYLEAEQPAIAFTLPRQEAAHVCEAGLHPFFENLVAEGWLRNAQARALKIDPNDRFALLLAFGRDCAGAVSLIDPAPIKEPVIDVGDAVATAALISRGSLSGVQPKLLAVKEGRHYRPARPGETSTHIAKLPSGTLCDIVDNEFLVLHACRSLLPDDKIVDAMIAPMKDVNEKALLVQRFDRLRSGAKIHFEEFNQLLGHRSGDDKYAASYEDMACFIVNTPGCVPAEAWRLYERVLACILTGNTDAHLKNFAMAHTPNGLRLTPAYDLVAAALYPEYRTFALAIGGAANLTIDRIKPKHIVALAKSCKLNDDVILRTVERLDARRKPVEKKLMAEAKRIGAEGLGTDILEMMERRWNGSFSSIGQHLSRRRSGADEE